MTEENKYIFVAIVLFFILGFAACYFTQLGVYKVQNSELNLSDTLTEAILKCSNANGYATTDTFGDLICADTDYGEFRYFRTGWKGNIELKDYTSDQE